jgi:hypothetical protein
LFDDETLLIKNKPKHPKKGEYKEQNGRTHTSKKTKEPPKRPNHKGNIVLFWKHNSRPDLLVITSLHTCK